MPFVKVSGGKYHYLIPSCTNHAKPFLDPTKPVVLMLHPRFVDSHFFAPQYRDARLAKGYNLLLVDHAYHGATEVNMDDKPYDFWKISKDILGVLDHLKIKEPVHVFGNSLGGPLAVRLRMLAPKRVASLMLCAKHPPVETADNLVEYRALRDACYERAEDGSDQLPADVVQALFWIYFGEHPSAAALIEEMVATSPFRPSNPKLITKLFSSLLDREPIPKKDWATITCPVLILHGGDDVPYPPEVAQEHYDSMPNADREMHIIPDAPHFLSWTHPQIVNQYTADFLDRVTGVDSKAAAERRIERSNTEVDSEEVDAMMKRLTVNGAKKKKTFLGRLGL